MDVFVLNMCMCVRKKDSCGSIFIFGFIDLSHVMSLCIGAGNHAAVNLVVQQTIFFYIPLSP